MQPASRASSEGRASPGSAWPWRRSPLRHGRYALAAFAAVFAVLCVLISHDAMAPSAVPDSLQWAVGSRVRIFAGISAAGKADGPLAPLPVSVLQKQPAADAVASELGPRSTSAPIQVEPGVAAAPVQTDTSTGAAPIVMGPSSAAAPVQMGPSSAADPVQTTLGNPPARSDVAPAPAATSPEAAGLEGQRSTVPTGIADSTAWNSRQLLPAVVDADGTGTGRTLDEERAADAEGCAVIMSEGMSGPLRIRHSRALVEPLNATGAAAPRLTSPLIITFGHHLATHLQDHRTTEARECAVAAVPTAQSSLSGCLQAATSTSRRRTHCLLRSTP